MAAPDAIRSGRVPRLALSVLVAAGLLIARTCPADMADQSWGFEVSGGWNAYGLDAVNDSLASLNRSLGTAFGTIDDGTGFGVALRMWANGSILIRLSAEKNTAISTDADRRFDIGTLDLTLGATYYLPLRSAVRLGAGLAGGATWIHGDVEGTGFSLEARGTTPQFRATLETLWPIAAGWFLSGSAGLRYAAVKEIKLDGQGSQMRADYSGPVLRIAAGRDWPWPNGDPR